MNVGIVTQPLRNNYGGILQNYALQQVLIKNGHQAFTIDWQFKRIPRWKIIASYVKVFVLNSFLGHKAKFPYYQPNKEETEIISQNNSRFVKCFISCTKRCWSTEDMTNCINDYDLKALITGSDQVWRPMYNGKFLYDMFFRFAKGKNVKRIAYAASFGTDRWEFTQKDTEECKQLVEEFDLITVREKSGVDLCELYLQAKAYPVLDPTLLLDKEEYSRLLDGKALTNHKNGLFYYILDDTPSKMSYINKAARKLGLTPYSCMPMYTAETITKKLIKEDIQNCIYPSVIDWLKAFEDAEAVVCDSFHGCVFSIIFNKPFWLIANTERGLARFSSLLELFGLEDRLLGENGLDSIIDFADKPIDWERVNNIKKKQKEDSLKLLLNVLNK